MFGFILVDWFISELNESVLMGNLIWSLFIALLSGRECM